MRLMRCWRELAHTHFWSLRETGRLVRWCVDCREKYQGWASKTRAERDAVRSPRRGLRSSGELRVRFVPRSQNRKTGPIPVSTTSSETCPPSCSLFGAGCYAEQHHTGRHWRSVPEVGLEWEAFCAAVASLPAGQVWRHNEAGDLPGLGEELDARRLGELVDANVGRRGFTFTHKPLATEAERRAVADANRLGFTVNLSADDLRDADALASLGVGPVVVVLASTTPDRGTTTPEGRRVVVCPAERTGVTCETCALCAKPWRKAIVGFRAHGNLAARVDEQLVQLRLFERRSA